MKCHCSSLRRRRCIPKPSVAERTLGRFPNIVQTPTGFHRVLVVRRGYVVKPRWGLVVCRLGVPGCAGGPATLRCGVKRLRRSGSRSAKAVEFDVTDITSLPGRWRRGRVGGSCPLTATPYPRPLDNSRPLPEGEAKAWQSLTVSKSRRRDFAPSRHRRPGPRSSLR